MSGSHLFWTLVNALWQSALLALVVGLAIRFVRRTTAAQRYAMWFAVLVVTALLPVLDLALPSRTISLPVSEARTPVVARAVAAVAEPAAPAVMLPSVVARPRSRPAIPWALLAWIAASGALLARLAIAYAALRSVKTSLVADPRLTEYARSLGVRGTRTPFVGTSDRVVEPCAIGFFHPAIALPQAMLASLEPSDLERVLRHECAHVRRYDDFANLFARLAGAVLFFNPVVHVVTRALAIEREIACDDAAAAAQNERVAFARCLYEIARSAPRRRHAAAAGFIGTRKQIAKRVARLCERNHNASTRLGSLAKAVIVTVLGAGIALGGVRLTALAVPSNAPAVAALAVTDPVARMRPGPERLSVRVERTTVERTQKASKTSVVVAQAAPTAAPPARSHPHPRKRERGSDHDLLDALATAGFHDLSVDDLIAFANHGVTARFVEDLHAHGLTPMPADSLTRLADSGVTAGYIEGLARAGYPNLPADQYVRLANAGVTVPFVQRLQRSGLLDRHASIDELIRLKDSGV